MVSVWKEARPYRVDSCGGRQTSSSIQPYRYHSVGRMQLEVTARYPIEMLVVEMQGFQKQNLVLAAKFRPFYLRNYRGYSTCIQFKWPPVEHYLFSDPDIIVSFLEQLKGFRNFRISRKGRNQGHYWIKRSSFPQGSQWWLTLCFSFSADKN